MIRLRNAWHRILGGTAAVTLFLDNVMPSWITGSLDEWIMGLVVAALFTQIEYYKRSEAKKSQEKSQEKSK